MDKKAKWLRRFHAQYKPQHHIVTKTTTWNEKKKNKIKMLALKEFGQLLDRLRGGE